MIGSHNLRFGKQIAGLFLLGDITQFFWLRRGVRVLLSFLVVEPGHQRHPPLVLGSKAEHRHQDHVKDGHAQKHHGYNPHTRLCA